MDLISLLDGKISKLLLLILMILTIFVLMDIPNALGFDSKHIWGLVVYLFAFDASWTWLGAEW